MRPPCDCFCDRMTNDDDEIDREGEISKRNAVYYVRTNMTVGLRKK